MTYLINIKNRNTIPTLIVGLAYLILSARLVWFVHSNAVNVLFWDQWDFLSPVFNESHNLWEIFSLQHGPHRQGLGGLILTFIYPPCDWNVRFESFLAVATIAVSSWMALIIKMRLWGKIQWTDAAIPLIYFTLLQYEIFIGTPNPAHGPLPIFLITLTAFLLTLENQIVRGLSLAFLVFFTSYTGFAIFSGIPLMLLLVVFSIKSTSPKIRYSNIAAFAISLILFLSFFINYHHAPAIDCYQFPHEHPVEYLKFSMAQFGNAWGLRTSPNYPVISLLINLAIFFLFLTLLTTGLFFAYKTIRCGDKKSHSIFYLTSFTLLFIAFTAIGRVCLGIGASGASRYVTYAVPGMLAFYFSYLEISKLSKLSSKIKKLILLVFFILLIFKESTIIRQRDTINWYRNGKQEWAKCYLEHKDVEYCNTATGFKVYPVDNRIQNKLNYLESNKLNFFKEHNK